MALKFNANFEWNLTCAFKNDMMNLASFHQSTFESVKIGTLMGSYCLKVKMYEVKTYREVMCHEELTCQFKISIRNLTNFDPST